MKQRMSITNLGEDESKHWTDSVRINKRFLQTLFEATHAQNKGRFTNQQAYLLYWLYHSSVDPNRRHHYKVGYELADPSMQMNVRNQLCKLEHEKLLIRVKPGTYRWPEGINEKIQGRVNPRKLRL